MHIRYNETLLQFEYSTTDLDTGPWTILPLANEHEIIKEGTWILF